MDFEIKTIMIFNLKAVVGLKDIDRRIKTDVLNNKRHLSLLLKTDIKLDNVADNMEIYKINISKERDK